jgi:ParB family chromosome partitioning protein
MMDRKLEWRNIGEIIPYARNSRTHSEEQVAQIAASIKEFGWTNPVLIDEENGIIAGHGRLAAARKLGHTEIPVIELTGLSEAQKRAYVIADNKLALNAGWDTEMLVNELRDLEGIDLSLTGFTIDEINALQPVDFDPATEEEQGKLDQLDPKWIACPHCGKEFDARQA